jgi:hypothetical protein
MTPGQLIKAVAIALDMPEETVTQHDRNLAVAGLRTMGGRGRSAPDVTPSDAARLLVATLGSIRTKDSVHTVKAYERVIFQAQDLEGRDAVADPAIAALPAQHNVVDALAALIHEASQPVTDLDAHLQRFAPMFMTFEAPWVKASIHHRVTGGFRYRTREWSKGDHTEEPPHRRYARYSGILQKRDIYGTAIMLLGRAFREDGLNFKTTAEAIDDFLGEKPAKKSKKVA